MGRHVDAVRSRGLAPWIVATVIGVVIVLAVTIGWIIVVRHADSADPGLCSQKVTVTVAAGPGASPGVSEAAASYNETNTVVRSACVTASVTTIADPEALKGLADQWPSKYGAVPGLWIPDSSAALASLDQLRPDAAAGHPTDPFAWSPVVLAMRSADAAATKGLTWDHLADAAGPHGSVALPDERHLLLTLPPLANNRATSYALQSLLATPTQSTPITAGTVTSHEKLLDAVGTGSVKGASTTAEALRALAAGTGTATAVPAVEAGLADFNRRHDDAALTGVYPGGQTVGDSLIAAPITDPTWVDRTLAAAASSFEAYLGSPAGQQIMANHGWRTPSSVAPKRTLSGIDLTAQVSTLPAGGPDVQTALASVLGQPAPITPTAPPVSTTSSSVPPTTGTDTTPTTTKAPTTSTATTKPPATTPTTSEDPAASGPIVTLVVDASEGTGRKVDDKTLLDWITSQLGPVTSGKITDTAGLWAFSDSGFLPPDGYPNLVKTGKLSGKVGDTTRAKAINKALSGLKSKGDRWAYGALIKAVEGAAKTVAEGRSSHVVVITTGVDETPGLPRSQVVDAVKKTKGKVLVDVIGVGNAVPVAAYTEIATASGGQYIPVTDPSKVSAALTDLLSPGP